MNDKVWIVDEFSKPADECIKTAKRKGYPIGEYDWFLDFPELEFDVVTTANDLSNHLREFVWHTNDAWGKRVLWLKDCRIVKGEFSECDSNNLSHAGAYYKIWIELPRRAVVGSPLEELMKEIPESEAIIANYPNGECPDCYWKIRKDVSDGDECRNCGHVFYASSDGTPPELLVYRLS